MFVFVWVLEFEDLWLWNMLNVSSEKITEEKEKDISGHHAVVPPTCLVDCLILSLILIKDFEKLCFYDLKGRSNWDLAI